MIAASNLAPNFLLRRKITAQDLRRLGDPAVIFEYEGRDDDGERFFAYTVAGWLDGINIADMQGGATVGGDVIVIHADNRADADLMAGMGLQDTIDSLEGEERNHLDALAARARLASINAVERVRQATKPNSDKSDAFVEDSKKMRQLAGDDIVLSTGGVAT